MKHNYILPNAHFHKDWARYVKLWFNQPAKKSARRAKRVERAKKLAPRPLDLLRPIVRSQTNKYNTKVRAGRGFSIAELKAAKIRRKEALTIGVPVDHRRQNRSEEAFQQNVARLKLYRSKLVLFPRNPTSQRAKKGDATKEELAKVTQVTTRHVLPIDPAALQKRVKARKITKDEANSEVYKVLHKARMDQKLRGAREKRAKDKAEGKTKEKKKQEASEEAMDD